MTQTDISHTADDAPIFATALRSNWVRLRTQVLLRWVAILGQLVAITVAQRLFDLHLELGWIYLVIGISVCSNLVAVFVYPENRRLSEPEMTGVLLFDICQLGTLLLLTGGLNNPFALFVLAPVTISATVLRLGPMLLVCGAAILWITVAARWHIPLITEDGSVMRMPEDFVFGFWVSIVIGTLFVAVYARRVTAEMSAMGDALAATQMALAREQKLTDLGGVVAAAAHELGTPLATITLVSGELAEDLEDPDHLADVRLIREQADRCRDILRSMGRAGKDDLHLKSAPLGAVVQEAAEPHQGRGRALNFDIRSADGADDPQPQIQRRPEIVHGLRNLVQNAVDFAASQVWIDVRWTTDAIILRIADDGPGYPQEMLPRLGDPFLRGRGAALFRPERPGYDGMGLGLFIAKTLLERSGAELSFANGFDPDAPDRRGPRTGALVEVVWRRDRIAADAPRDALGENEAFHP
ncbi:HAMP domain-containing histidine kinase [Rhodobacteraceae bacterium CCMM004]|nr:HAMP domain-containing histidine kinase [Rhodobacteraceae bacterium CCMM004]